LALPKLLFQDIKLPTSVSRGTPLTTKKVATTTAKPASKPAPKPVTKTVAKPVVKATPATVAKAPTKTVTKPVIKTQLPVQITKTVAQVPSLPPKEVMKAEAIAADIGPGDRLPQKAKAPTAPTPTKVQPTALATVGKPIAEQPPVAKTIPTTTVTPTLLPKDVAPAPLLSKAEAMMADIGPGDRLGNYVSTKDPVTKKPTTVLPSNLLDKAILNEEIKQASNVSLLPGKSVLPIEDRLSDVIKNIAAQETKSRLIAGPPPPEAVVESVGTTPPSEEEIGEVLQKTADRAAEMETEARRQLFYRGQVKRRGGIRMLFGKYAFPTPRKLAPAVDTATKSVVSDTRLPMTFQEAQQQKAEALRGNAGFERIIIDTTTKQPINYATSLRPAIRD